jgi:hypothetical protein
MAAIVAERGNTDDTTTTKDAVTDIVEVVAGASDESNEQGEPKKDELNKEGSAKHADEKTLMERERIKQMRGLAKHTEDDRELVEENMRKWDEARKEAWKSGGPARIGWWAATLYDVSVSDQVYNLPEDTVAAVCPPKCDMCKDSVPSYETNDKGKIKWVCTTCLPGRRAEMLAAASDMLGMWYVRKRDSDIPEFDEEQVRAKMNDFLRYQVKQFAATKTITWAEKKRSIQNRRTNSMVRNQMRNRRKVSEEEIEMKQGAAAKISKRGKKKDGEDRVFQAYDSYYYRIQYAAEERRQQGIIGAIAVVYESPEQPTSMASVPIQKLYPDMIREQVEQADHQSEWCLVFLARCPLLRQQFVVVKKFEFPLDRGWIDAVRRCSKRPGLSV